jgi:aminopeptidase-like protein
MTYKKSRQSSATIDRAVMQVLRDTAKPHAVQEFSPYGYDERQFCSPGVDLPVGCLMRTPPGKFPEYHTSGDDMSFITPEALGDSFARLVDVVSVLETNRVYVNQKPHGEPRLGKRGLYGATGGSDPADLQMAMLWVLNLSDGTRDLLDIASRSGMPYNTLQYAAEMLGRTDLLTAST